MISRLKNISSVLLPYFLSLALLAWLFHTNDYKQMWQAVIKSDVRYMSAAGIIFFLINFLMLWRWRILMKALGLKARRMTSTRWFFLGLFFNLAPISSVGSDVIRGFGLAKETGHRPKVFASIVLDRLSGFAGIVILALAAFIFAHGVIANKLVIIAIMTMSIVSGAIVIALFSHRIFSFACKAFAAWPKIKESLMRFHYDIVLLKGKQKQGWEAIIISIAAQIVLAFEFYLSAKGLHQNIDLKYFIIFSPIVCIMTSLPSLVGAGFREIGWVSLLYLVGVSHSMALDISLITSAFNVINGLLGGLLYVTTLSFGRIQCPQADCGFQGSPS